jgi:hypothetical protein
VDTLGLLIAVTVVVASMSDNAGGIVVVDKARLKSVRLSKLWCDGGFKTTFIQHCRQRHIAAEVVNRIHAHEFKILPRRWVTTQLIVAGGSQAPWVVYRRARLVTTLTRRLVVVDGLVCCPTR